MQEPPRSPVSHPVIFKIEELNAALMLLPPRPVGGRLVAVIVTTFPLEPKVKLHAPPVIVIRWAEVECAFSKRANAATAKIATRAPSRYAVWPSVTARPNLRLEHRRLDKPDQLLGHKETVDDSDFTVSVEIGGSMIDIR